MAVARRFPFGENLTAATKELCCQGPCSRWPVDSDQTQTVLSSDPVAILVPSGETSTARMQLLCALKSVTFSWLSAFHTVTWPLSVQLMIHFPFRDAAMFQTIPPASIGVPTSVPSSTFQHRIFCSLPPLTTCFPARRATEYMSSR